MAAKALFLLALIAAVASAADTDCNCDPPSELENTDLWDFLKKLSSELTDEENNERLDAVLPGELSPLLECNCLKTETRRKRKIFPQSAEEVQESYSEDHFKDRRTSKCPQGTVWMGIMCVDETFLLDK